jgi:LPS-assembly lipoprotein
MKTIHKLAALLLTLMLAACGFRLRDEIALPAALSVLRVDVADTYSPLQRNLEQAMRRAGAQQAPAPEGVAVLRVFSNRLDRLPLSVGDTGRVQEYLLKYEVDFELVDATGATVLPRQLVVLERYYTFDTLQAIGTPGEEEVVRDELERDMVQAILRRVEAATRG